MDSQLKTHFTDMAKWQKIVGIFFAISVAFMLLAGLMFIILGATMGSGFAEEFAEELGSDMGGLGLICLGILYLLLGLLYLFPTKYLLNSSKKINLWAITDDEALLTEGVKNSKSFFKFTGLLLIIGVIAAFVAVVAIVIATIIGLA